MDKNYLSLMKQGNEHLHKHFRFYFLEKQFKIVVFQSQAFFVESIYISNQYSLLLVIVLLTWRIFQRRLLVYLNLKIRPIHFQVMKERRHIKLQPLLLNTASRLLQFCCYLIAIISFQVIC